AHPSRSSTIPIASGLCRRTKLKNLLVSASSFSLYFAISFSSLDFLFLFTDVIVTGFMNFLQLNPAQSLFHTA
ncbi:TPA: hypothetical protein R2S63_003321, partial [Escherichia coli]|nr:hypothetical protein [Escherichia coli]